jgi:hypothetical protein
MPFIEAPTTFYLGRRVNPETNQLDEDVVYYDSRDLTTHAIVVGMTGSGKTGLCVTLLEEAILDNIPAIVIDPKGDITNLLLTFPDMRPEDFKAWIDPDDARRAGMEMPTYASHVAQRWKDGLESWGIVPERLRWLQMATQYSIFTPGSDSGLPISIMASLRAPKDGWNNDNDEELRENISAVTTALLALTGKNAEPVKDPEHVLVSNIFEHAWRQGLDLTLEEIILQVKSPPFEKLGVFPVDKFMNERARLKLAMELNNIIASPSFKLWVQGHPLDIQSLLYQPNGRPRVSIFYTAHLSDQERMFITTLLLENLIGWMRTLSGTTSLRALLYIDEMFGYFPPHPRNPPTKMPIMRLLKQARAFGVGLILATQNPGDLDYQGLSNAGTWFIGRLQSNNDKKRVIAGLRTMATAQEDMNMRDVEMMISDIAPRVFLMRNVHDDESPLLLHTRWAMSYLRGPLTRQQIQHLMTEQRQQLFAQVARQYSQTHQTAWSRPIGSQPMVAPPPDHSGQGGAPPPMPPGLPEAPARFPGVQQAGNGGAFGAQSVPGQGGWPQQPGQFPVPSQPSQLATSGGSAPQEYSRNRPPITSQITQYFLKARLSSQQAVSDWEQRTGYQAQHVGGAALVYQPVLLAQAVVRYQDRRASIYTARHYAYHIPDLRKSGLIHWEDYETAPIDPRSVSGEPLEGAVYAEPASGLYDSSRLSQLRREITDLLYNTKRLAIPFNPELKIYGDPDVDPSEFQAAVVQAAREQRDAEMDQLSSRYGTMLERLEEKLRRKEQELRAEQKELTDRRKEELYTTGEAILSLFRGRTNYTLSRMSRATRYRRQTKEDLRESHEFMDEVERQIGDLEIEYEQALAAVNDKWAQVTTIVEDHVISPYKKDIQLELFGVGWLPAWHLNVNGQAMVVEAY